MNSPTSSPSDAAVAESVPGAAPEASRPQLPPPAVADSKPPPENPPPLPARPPAGRSAAAGWALLLALLSCGVAAYSLWLGREWNARNVEAHRTLAAKLEKSDAIIAESRELPRQLPEIQSRLDEIAGKVEKSEGHALALENFYQQFSRSQEDSLIVEVRQAVTIANQQLQYAGNVETALVALRGALARLEQNDYGQFAPLRRALAADIEKLGRQGALDIPDTALRLEQLLAKVDTLPLLYSGEVPATPADAPAAAPPEEKDAGFADFAGWFAREIWRELRSLVKFERLGTEAEPVLLAPEQSAFLRENLKIRLLTARLALLARDGHTYEADLSQARNWIERFFDMRDQEVKLAVDNLRALEAMPVRVQRYELIESITALRGLEIPRPRPAASLPAAGRKPDDGGASAGVEARRGAEETPAAAPAQP
ncbi:MAG: uroporphyrinogen-III C-methyltransferase [Azoarcus sp.]|jgi:uroporphyrin-3 C-methyltransferase|nr:uroporphyrinogen-III C-methyltransferase [Azoarcus sp.]